MTDRAMVAPQAYGPTKHQALLLTALNFRHAAGDLIYAGTVAHDDVQRRRVRNRAARRARRINRRSW